MVVLVPTCVFDEMILPHQAWRRHRRTLHYMAILLQNSAPRKGLDIRSEGGAIITSGRWCPPLPFANLDWILEVLVRIFHRVGNELFKVLDQGSCP